MINFVIKLSDYSKNKKPNFIIIPQNALNLVENENYLTKIDAVGKEDTWYLDNEKINNEQLKEDLKYLKIVKENNKPVFLIDYPTKENLRYDFIEKAKVNGFIPFVSNRELNSLE